MGSAIASSQWCGNSINWTRTRTTIWTKWKCRKWRTTSERHAWSHSFTRVTRTPTLALVNRSGAAVTKPTLHVTSLKKRPKRGNSWEPPFHVAPLRGTSGGCSVMLAPGSAGVPTSMGMRSEERVCPWRRESLAVVGRALSHPLMTRVVYFHPTYTPPPNDSMCSIIMLICNFFMSTCNIIMLTCTLT